MAGRLRFGDRPGVGQARGRGEKRQGTCFEQGMVNVTALGYSGQGRKFLTKNLISRTNGKGTPAAPVKNGDSASGEFATTLL
ncbi:MAG: hypothetical protein LIQ31_10495, partial [Planctomycetes bacterium]|nr:hypothetical protein [Planctomycetota bacterium]